MKHHNWDSFESVITRQHYFAPILHPTCLLKPITRDSLEPKRRGDGRTFMHGRCLCIALSIALTLALCCSPCVHAQSGRVRQLRQDEKHEGGLSGREVKMRTKVALEQRDQIKTTEELSGTDNRRFHVRGLNEAKLAPVTHAREGEHITFAVIAAMMILIFTRGKM